MRASEKTIAQKLTEFILPHRNSSVTTGLFAPAPNTYWAQFEEISKYNVQLNYAEKMWAAWYAYMQNDVLATGIMSFVMHELVYFGRSLPWIIADRVPWLNKYKIQNVRLPAPPILLLRLIFPFRFSAWSLRARKADS
jgi:hypothetical protein